MKKYTSIRLLSKKHPPIQDRELKYSDLLHILEQYEIKEEMGRPWHQSRRLVRQATKTTFAISWIKKPSDRVPPRMITKIRKRFDLTPERGVTDAIFYSRL